MITKFITFKLDLSQFNSIKQIVQLTNGYAILGEQFFEQKLSIKLHLIESTTIALNNQLFLYFEVQNGCCKFEEPYQIGQGLAILSNIVSNDKFLVALISRQGNRSLIQFDPKQQTNSFLIPHHPYQQYQLDCESTFKLFSFNEQIILIEIHHSEQLLILVILSHPKAQRIEMQCKVGQNIQIQKIHNTNQILIVVDEDFHIFDGSNEIMKMNKQMPTQFKVKFVIEIQEQQILILKDRVDKFYKFCDFRFDSDYFFTLKSKELLNGQVSIETEKKQSINLSKFKGEFYIWISTIYKCKDEDSKILYINAFKLNNQLQAQFIENYKFWKSQSIEFIFKDEFVREYLFFRDQQTVKGLYIS
ncbi:unnamed protein product (macronuclear) [Paramecium tetraurelia]|uniref:Cleavage/polyadenylation specificity factor A subunit N-terminal domain-containing protein n=1 Tax=Paramecium tetraurelia TaxID=5888 RepID=A0CL88_PARTE|nr:uncharacterized protein GSPATT00008102001 [Paramecium tetraurelia]CAK71555.1 unnamed protein product [Paramecium tetraurelia]|eukprot:XP_001438952.1 hypothetical protein (macronuclear) [Paramecium tetraurelia strain d4-2]